MNVYTILQDSLFAALFAASMTAVLSAPRWAIAPAFLLGFLVRGLRDVLTGVGVGPVFAVLIASTAAVSLAFLLTRQRALVPVIVVSGLLPLGAATALLRGIVGLLKMSSLKGEAAAEAAVSTASNFAIGFNTTLAIAIGFWFGYAIVAVVNRKIRNE